jgi:hypothetical protein|tara:strand:- start:605 stop:1201 length:597 start_codon:yes stop_codon:yes gene_type:complete
MSNVVKVIKKPIAVKKTAKTVAVKKIAKIKKAGVGKHYEKIARNKSLYGKRIKQLKAITNDENYIPSRGTTGTKLANSYHDFIFSMYGALISGRKITPKMESSITKIVKTYADWLKKENDPEHKKKKEKYIEDSLFKISMIEKLLEEANYTRSYESNSKWFLNSISEQVKKRGSLTVKQRKALNKMYKQFTKKIEKGK